MFYLFAPEKNQIEYTSFLVLINFGVKFHKTALLLFNLNNFNTDLGRFLALVGESFEASRLASNILLFKHL